MSSKTPKVVTEKQESPRDESNATVKHTWYEKVPEITKAALREATLEMEHEDVNEVADVTDIEERYS